MIFDKVSNLYKYIDVNPSFKDVIEFIKKTDLTKLPVEKKVINDNVWYNSQEYMGKENTNKYESHIKYIDIQLMIDGEEYIYYSKDTPIINERNDKDMYLTESNDKTVLKLTKGTFMIFLPGELHNPGLKSNDKLIKKVIFKVLAN